MKVWFFKHGPILGYQSEPDMDGNVDAVLAEDAVMGEYDYNPDYPYRVYQWMAWVPVEMTYDDICHALGADSGIHFVEVTHGKVGYTLGKPDDIDWLKHQVNAIGAAWYDDKLPGYTRKYPRGYRYEDGTIPPGVKIHHAEELVALHEASVNF